MNYKNKKLLLNIAEEAVFAAVKKIKSSNPKVVRSFGKDIKIDIDIQSHDIITKILKKTNIPVLSEEDFIHNFDMDLKWVVDPLDGSINFLRGIPFYSVSIALMEKNEPIIGLVYDICREEMFSGIVGVGAWLNKKRIRVSSTKDKKEAIIMTGFPPYTDYSKKALKKYISTVQSFKKMRLMGSAALALAYVACGRVDAYYEKDIKIWDVAAGLAIIKSAGGNYLNTENGKRGECTICAGNVHILTFLV